MKNLFKLLAVLVLIQAAFGTGYRALAQDKQPKAKTETVKIWTSITCAGCVAKVEKNIPFEKGVTGLNVDLPTKMVTVNYKPTKTNPQKLEKALQKLGYKTEIIPENK